MRKRVMVYDPGTGTMKPAWSENQPGAYAGGGVIGGELVTGMSGSNRVLGRREAQAEATRARAK